MTVKQGFKSIVNNAKKPVDIGVIRSIDGDKVSITIGSSPNLLRHVKVIGSTRNLIPGMEVQVLWNKKRPYILTGSASNDAEVSVTTNQVMTAGTLSAASTNDIVGAHTHEIASSSDPGVASSILQTNEAGGVLLEYLQAKKLGIGMLPTNLIDVNAGDTQDVVIKISATHIYSLLQEFANASADWKIGLGENGEFVVSDAGNLTNIIRVQPCAIDDVVLISSAGLVSLGLDHIVLGGHTLTLATDMSLDGSGAVTGSGLVYDGSKWVPGALVNLPNVNPPDGLSRNSILAEETYTIPAGYAMVTDELEILGTLDLQGHLVLIDTGGISSVDTTDGLSLQSSVLHLTSFTGDTGAGGAKGGVPAPEAGSAAAGKYLKADGTWAVPAGQSLSADSADGLSIAANVINLAPFTGDSGSGGAQGAVPAPATGDASKFLCGNGTWSDTPNRYPCQGRLSLSSTLAVPTSTISGATTLYFHPFRGNRIALYYNSAWREYDFSATNISLSGKTADAVYDVFGYYSGSALALELLAWTNTTTRATALATDNGVLVKSGDASRRYLGTIAINSTGGQTDDNLTSRLVWNYYNRMPTLMRRSLLTQWSVGSSVAWRYARSNTNMYVKYVVGVVEDIIDATYQVRCSVGTGTGYGIGIGLDGVAEGNLISVGIPFGGSGAILLTKALITPSEGVHSLTMMEENTTTNTYTLEYNAIWATHFS